MHLFITDDYISVIIGDLGANFPVLFIVDLFYITHA